MSILREAEIDPGVLKGSSIASGLAAYQALLDQERAFDYTAILDRAVACLEQNAGVRARLSERVRHVIVDEYQDVNPIQERLVRALYELGANVCVVGDDDQTIYQWRGSDVEQILTFPQRYREVEQVTLAENLRSSEAVVTLARDFIEGNQRRSKLAKAGG